MARSEARGSTPTVITAARHPRSLDVETRQRRYLWSMLVRTLLFAAVFFVPGLAWKFACALGAAFIPSIAVMLANNADNHKLPPPAPDEPSRPALPGGQIIPGSIEEEGPAGGQD